MYNFASENKLKQQICQIGKLVFDKGFVAANDGNISCRININEILVTPTRMSKGFMEPSDIIKVNLKGEVISGRHKPSSELKMHLKVYEERPDINAVVHVHPPFATAHAIAGLSLNKATMPESVLLLGTIPLAEYGTPSTTEIPEAIAKYVHDHRGVLLENHGALTWGEDLFSAYFVMESLEFTAKINWIAHQMNGVRELSTKRVKELVQIKEAMGIEGISPTGAPCSDDQNACFIDSDVQQNEEIDDSQLDEIVNKVTEAVLNRLGLSS